MNRDYKKHIIIIKSVTPCARGILNEEHRMTILNFSLDLHPLVLVRQIVHI